MKTAASVTGSTFVALALSVGLLVAPSWARSQWTNRYPKIEGYRHHIYLEGFELPILAAGPTDPAPSPDGKSIAIASRGWLWLVDLESGAARRLTKGGAMDSRPTWSVDGSRIAFLRDDSSDLDIWVLDIETGDVQPIVETDAIELDPIYSSDGEFLYYSSGQAGTLDIWRFQLATAERMPVTSHRGIEIRPLPLDGQSLVFLSKGRGGPDRLVYSNRETGLERTLRTQSIMSQTHPGLSPDGKTLAVNWPSPDGYDLYLVDWNDDDAIRLNARSGLPISPAFSHDGKTVYFVEANDELEFELFAVPATGGKAKRVPIRSWDWGVPTGRVVIRTTRAESASPLAARLHVADANGHPALPASSSMPHFDGVHGKVYFYSPGVVSVEVPAGEVRIEASHGFSAKTITRTVQVEPGSMALVDLPFEFLWEPRQDGWYSADHHYHMNYGGPYRLAPEDLLLPLQAEDVDVGTPLMANLHHRFNDLEHFEYRRLEVLPFLTFGQEVRSHLLGHLGLIGIVEPHWPWYWGPDYPVYGQDDRPNHDVLRFARKQGGVTSYMHPVSRSEPFLDEEAMRAIPINLIPDAVLGDLDTLELACLWISELGTHDVWYRFLNVGAPVAASAGTDIMADYYRTMAVGATRVYVRVDEPMTFERYLHALKQGRSFVSTGPLVDFRVGESAPGDVIDGDGGLGVWSLRLSTPMPVEKIELIVNGKVVHAEAGPETPGEKRYSGTVPIPSGGWIAIRVHGGEEQWPGMNGYPFAHSSPIWIGERGSTDPSAARRSAAELLAALDVAERRLDEGYGSTPIPRLKARFRDARKFLEGLAEGAAR